MNTGSYARLIRSAFTLVELLAVLIIMAIVSSLVGLSLRSHLERAARIRVEGQLHEADRRARIVARLSPAPVILDVHSDALFLSATRERFELPNGFTLELRPRQGRARERRIAFYADGSSQSYILQISHHDHQLWFCMFGLSGQGLVVDDESLTAELFPVGT